MKALFSLNQAPGSTKTTWQGFALSIFNAQFLESNGIKLRQTIEKTPQVILKM